MIDPRRARPGLARGGRRRRVVPITFALTLLHLLRLRLHAQPRDAVRADLRRSASSSTTRSSSSRTSTATSRRSGGRRSKLAAILAVDGGRQPDDPGDLHGHRRAAADGLRARPDGPVHARRCRSAPRWRWSSRCSWPSIDQPPGSAYRLLRRVGTHDAGHDEQAGRGIYGLYGRRPAPAAGAAARKRLVALRRRGLLLAGAVAIFPLQDGPGEDAAVRQQERVAGRRRHARGHDARGRRRAWRARSATTWPRCRRSRTIELYAGDRGAGQLQRPGPPLLPAARRQRRRRPGQPGPEGRARRRRATRSPSAIRPQVEEIAQRHGARVKIVEIPPGPPVLSTLVAEVYGPDAGGRRRSPSGSRRSSSDPPASWTSTGSSRTPAEGGLRRRQREGRAARRLGRAGRPQSLARWSRRGRRPAAPATREAEPVPICVAAPAGAEPRRSAELSAVQRAVDDRGAWCRWRSWSTCGADSRSQASTARTCKPVVYVSADVAGPRESPIYAILEMADRSALELPGDEMCSSSTAAQPGDRPRTR